MEGRAITVNFNKEGLASPTPNTRCGRFMGRSTSKILGEYQEGNETVTAWYDRC